jgi:hypothetical protein
VRERFKRACLAGAGLAALALLVVLALGGTFLVQHFSESPEDATVSRMIGSSPSSSPPRPGRVVLSLSSAYVTVSAGPSGEPVRVESEFDPEVFELSHEYEENGEGGWVYRVDFHERTNFHVSVVRIWLGRRKPEVRVVLPRDVPIALEARMRGGYLALDLAGLALTTVDLELNRGVLGLLVSEPLASPLDRLSLQGRMGTMSLLSLGNASPRELSVTHGIGAAYVDLQGHWIADADVSFQVAFGSGNLQLPRGVRVEGVDRHDTGLVVPSDEELSPPTVRVHTHHDIGDIRILD